MCVQQHDGGVIEKRSRDGNALALPSRHRGPALFNHRIVAMVHRQDEVVAVGGLGRSDNLRVGGVRLALLARWKPYA